ncbi:MAG: protein kinase, partial [Candidatus Aminicenantes bacterium]
AWERKIIHRDIKPSNILLDQKNQVKLADFGMAKSTQIKDERTLTSPIVFRGSPYYVSPERAKGDPVDFHGDIYSLGIVLYEMLVGERPFEGTTLMEVIGKHIRDPIPPIKKKQPGIPGQVQELIEWMTQKDPKKRPSSYAEIMDFLDSIPQTRETGETPVIPGVHPLFGNMRHANFVLWAAGFLVFVVITWILSNFFLVDKPGISAVTRDKKSFVVAVTPFYGPDENSRREGKVMTFLVKKAIREQLGKENAEVISLEETLETVRSHEQARTLGERLGATVVIWGETFTVREETEIQPYFTIIPIKKEAEKTQVETDFNIFDPFRGPDAGFQEKSVEPIVIEAEAPNQIELRKTTAKGIGDMVSLLAGIHALNRENNAPKALALLNQAPESSEALRYRAYALLGLGKKDRALKALNKAVLLDPGDAVSFALMGDLHMKAGKFQEAVKAYKAAAETGKPYTGKRAIYYDNKLYCKEVFTSKLYNRYKYRKKKETVTRYLLESDPLTGQVTARYCLPGVPESFTIRDNSIHIEYRYFYLKEKIIFANGKFDRPVFYGGDILLRWQSMWSGWALAANFMEQLEKIHIPFAEFKLRTHRVFSDAPGNLQALENSLEKAIIKDPTQPWHLFFLGQALWAQGQKQKAKKTWENIFSLKFPHIPYYEFSYMAYFFEHLGQTDRADKAYHEALKRRNQLPLPGEFSSLLERFINAPNIRKAAMLSKEDKDTDRAYLWLKRVRKLMGICPGDYLASLSWEKYFRRQGDMEKAGRETAVQKRAKAHPVNDLEAYAYSNYAIYLLTAASIAFLLVFILLVTKAARQVTLTNTRNIKHREDIKKSHLLQMIARVLQTNKLLWEFIPIITAFAGITILFITHEKHLYYYILIALFLVFIYILRISKKWPIRKFIACFSIPARGILGISLFFIIITSLAVLSAYKTTFVTYKLMGRSPEYLGHAVFVHDLENLLKEKNTDVVRYAAAVINHLAGNRDRAAELYQSLPRDPRAQKNLHALEQDNLVPP